MTYNILVVDDEKNIRRTFAMVLEGEGYTVATAETGEDSLVQYREHRPDAVILDVKLPGIDGIEVLRRVKKTQPAIEVIILTGHGSEADKKVCMELGAFAYLQKPVDIDELSGTIKAAHDKIRRTRDNMKPIQTDL